MSKVLGKVARRPPSGTGGAGNAGNGANREAGRGEQGADNGMGPAAGEMFRLPGPG
jgi:hypothetical protein